MRTHSTFWPSVFLLFLVFLLKGITAPEDGDDSVDAADDSAGQEDLSAETEQQIPVVWKCKQLLTTVTPSTLQFAPHMDNTAPPVEAYAVPAGILYWDEEKLNSAAEWNKVLNLPAVKAWAKAQKQDKWLEQLTQHMVAQEEEDKYKKMQEKSSAGKKGLPISNNKWERGGGREQLAMTAVVGFRDDQLIVMNKAVSFGKVEKKDETVVAILLKCSSAPDGKKTEILELYFSTMLIGAAAQAESAKEEFPSQFDNIKDGKLFEFLKDAVVDTKMILDVNYLPQKMKPKAYSFMIRTGAFIKEDGEEPEEAWRFAQMLAAFKFTYGLTKASQMAFPENFPQNTKCEFDKEPALPVGKRSEIDLFCRARIDAGLQKDLIYTKHEEYEIGWVMGQRAKAFELTINRHYFKTSDSKFKFYAPEVIYRTGPEVDSQENVKELITNKAFIFPNDYDDPEYPPLFVPKENN